MFYGLISEDFFVLRKTFPPERCLHLAMDTFMNTKTPTVTWNHMINVSEDEELHFWAKKFGITPEKLKSAVRAVGSSVPTITKYLNKN